jgi:hypothetical protein
MKVAVTGSSGFVGSALVAALRERGDEVLRVVRSFGGVSARERVAVWHPDSGQIEAVKLEGVDAVVNLAGESVAGVWTPGRKRAIRDSRVHGTNLLARTLAGLQQKPNVFVSVSGMNFYGERPGSSPVDETSPPGEGFLAEVAIAWETAADAARDAGIRVVHPRLGNVLHPSGGMLKTLLPLYRLGFGAKFGSGDQMWPWVTREDVVRALLFLMARTDVSGPVNLVAPEAVSNARFTDELARAVERPSVLKVPAFALRVLPGNMADELLLGGANIVPRKLEDAGFTFRWPRLREALAAMLSRPRASH